MRVVAPVKGAHGSKAEELSLTANHSKQGEDTDKLWAKQGRGLFLDQTVVVAQLTSTAT